MRDFARHPASPLHGVPPMITLDVNGKQLTTDAADDTPLLWVLRDQPRTSPAPSSAAAWRSAAPARCTSTARPRAAACCRSPRSRARRSPPSRTSAAEAGGQGRAGGVDRRERAAVRLLPVGPDHERRGAAGSRTRQAHRCRHRRRHDRQHLPLRHLPAHPRRHPARRRLRWPEENEA